MKIRGVAGGALFLSLILIGSGASGKPDYNFNGSISREVLENYLSRAVTHSYLCAEDNQGPNLYFNDDIRMLTAIGAKFIGRAAITWLAPDDIEEFFLQAEEYAGFAHQSDPEFILQAGIFECVSSNVVTIPVPPWVFQDFGIPVESRNFSYTGMLFPGGLYHDFWAPGASIPDMSRRETRLWFYYRARQFIDCGYEAIHFGCIGSMTDEAGAIPGLDDLLGRVRAYGKMNARRSVVLCDAHTHGILVEGRLLFDFHSFPLRVQEVSGEPYRGELVVGLRDSIYGQSLGGVTPGGWSCQHLPYLVEVDHWGSSGQGGESICDEADVACYWIWGWDEMDWFARQPESERNRWLVYADNWVKEHDPAGHFQPATRRALMDPIGSVVRYSANRSSPACPDGSGQEDTIRAIWSDPPLVIPSADYDGDGTGDPAIFRPANGLWAVRSVTRVYYGRDDDRPVPGDYNGDGTTGIGIFRGETGLWAIRGWSRFYFGSTVDLPVPGDYDGNSLCDPAVFRDYSGLWAVRGITRRYFGATGDIPVPGDYSGDGTSGIGIFRRMNGLWALRGISRIYFGGTADTPAGHDYNGDGIPDPAVFRSATGLWASRGISRFYFGGENDEPIPGNYNGAGVDEAAVFRPANGLWAVRPLSRFYYGRNEDIPVVR
jgi:hypothetical protein